MTGNPNDQLDNSSHNNRPVTSISAPYPSFELHGRPPLAAYRRLTSAVEVGQRVRRGGSSHRLRTRIRERQREPWNPFVSWRPHLRKSRLLLLTSDVKYYVSTWPMRAHDLDTSPAIPIISNCYLSARVTRDATFFSRTLRKLGSRDGSCGQVEIWLYLGTHACVRVSPKVKTLKMYCNTINAMGTC